MRALGSLLAKETIDSVLLCAPSCSTPTSGRNSENGPSGTRVHKERGNVRYRKGAFNDALSHYQVALTGLSACSLSQKKSAEFLELDFDLHSNRLQTLLELENATEADIQEMMRKLLISDSLSIAKRHKALYRCALASFNNSEFESAILYLRGCRGLILENEEVHFSGGLLAELLRKECGVVQKVEINSAPQIVLSARRGLGEKTTTFNFRVVTLSMTCALSKPKM